MLWLSNARESGETAGKLLAGCDADFGFLPSLLRSTVAGVSLDSARLEGSCKGSCSRKGTFTGELEREVYSCERLSTIRGGYTSLTQPQAVLKFDFNQPEVSLKFSLFIH